MGDAELPNFNSANGCDVILLSVRVDSKFVCNEFTIPLVVDYSSLQRTNPPPRGEGGNKLYCGSPFERGVGGRVKRARIVPFPFANVSGMKYPS